VEKRHGKAEAVSMATLAKPGQAARQRRGKARTNRQAEARRVQAGKNAESRQDRGDARQAEARRETTETCDVMRELARW
jgi:hypothetical protein